MSRAYHTAFILGDGTVNVCGNNTAGQLGLGIVEDYHTVPTIVSGLENVRQVALGNGHSVYLLNDGTIKACGTNSDGQLGDGTKVNKSVPATISGIGNVKQVFCGDGCTFFLMQDGTVKAYGASGLGVNGVVTGLENVNQIASSFGHTIFVFKDGTIKVCGSNSCGELGIGTIDSESHPLVQVKGIHNVKKAACGLGNSVLLLNDGTVMGCGLNDFGQIGDGTKVNKNSFTAIPGVSGVVDVSCGCEHTILLLQDGSVKGYGRNSGYELADIPSESPNSGVLIPTAFTGLIKKVKQIYCGYNYTLFLLEDGIVMGCGTNSDGQFGTGKRQDSFTTVKVLSNISNVAALPDNLLDNNNMLPLNLSATAGDAKVTLNWNSISGVTSYNVKRSTTPGGPYEVIANVKDNTYVDRAVTNGTTYYYVVTAVTDKGEGVTSNEASATPKAGSPSDDGKGKYLLVVTLAEEVEREYALSKADLDNFISWYTAKADGNGKAYYIFDKIFNRKDYLVYDKILTFEVTDFTK